MDTTHTIHGWPPKILMITFVGIIAAVIVIVSIAGIIVQKCQKKFQDREDRSTTSIWPFRMCLAKNRV